MKIDRTLKKYVKIENNEVWLIVDQQSFLVAPGNRWENQEATWMKDRLLEALTKIKAGG